MSNDPSYWMYFQEEEKYNNDFSVYGETFLTEGVEDYADAFQKILNGRVRDGHGKWASAKLSSGRVRLVKVLDVSDFAKKVKRFGKNQKIDQFLVEQVTSAEERGDGEYVVGLSAEQLYERIVDYLKENSSLDLYKDFDYEEIPAVSVTPRCDEHIKDIEKFRKELYKFLLKNGIDVSKRTNWNDEDFSRCRKLSKHFIMLWCCGTGKSTTPVLVYEMILEELWNYKKSNPINLVTSPTLKVLVGNLITLAGNAKAKNKNEVHICFTSGVEKDKNTLTYLLALGVEVINDRTQFINRITELSSIHTVWVHTTYQSYYYRSNGVESKNCLTYLMRKAKKDFYFGYIDEVHKTYQPNQNPFSAIHYDEICRIENRFKCTASKPEFKGPKSVKLQKEFHTGNYNDVVFPRLTIKDAHKRGYIRNYKVLDFLIPQNLLDTLIGQDDIVEVIYEKKIPFISVPGSNIVVPVSYYFNILSQLYIRYAGVSPITHTLGVVNTVANGKLYRDFFYEILPLLVNQVLKVPKSDPMHSRLMNIHCDVMDTHAEADSVKIFSRIDQIPLKYQDSIIVHCYVAEVGWNPGNTLSKEEQRKFRGFVDSVTFIDRISAADRIQQNCGRGARWAELTKHFKNTCFLILNHLIDYDNEKINPYNKRFDYTRKACRALEIGEEELQQSVLFYDFTNSGNGGGGGSTKGNKHPTAMFTVGNLSGVDNQWMIYRENEGYYSPLFNITSKIIDDFEKYCEINNWNSIYINEKEFRLQFAKHAAENYRHHFGATTEEMWRKTKSILNGSHYSVSLKEEERLDQIKEKLKNNTTIFVKKHKEDLLDCFEQFYNNLDVNVANGKSVEDYISQKISDFFKIVENNISSFSKIKLLNGVEISMGSGRGGNGFVARKSIKKLNPNYTNNRVLELLNIPEDTRYKFVLDNIKKRIEERNFLIKHTVEECVKNYTYEHKWPYAEAVQKLPEIRSDIITKIGSEVTDEMKNSIPQIRKNNIERFENFAINLFEEKKYSSLKKWIQDCFEKYDRYLPSHTTVIDGIRKSSNPKIINIINTFNMRGPAKGQKAAKPLMTPKGRFDNRKQAAENYGVSVSAIGNYIKTSPREWYWLDEET